MTEKLHPEEIVTSVVLVRHGHTLQTEQGRLYSDHAALLTEKGKKQAESVAEWLPRETPEVLLSSTASRVVGTADLVAKVLSLPVQSVPGLDEQNVGEWEGKSYLEIKKANPDEYKAWCADPIRNCAPQAESICDVYNRVNKDFAELLKQHHGRKIVLVTHAGVIRSIIIAALGMPIDNFWRISVPTGSATKIDFSSGFATLQYMSLRLD